MTNYLWLSLLPKVCPVDIQAVLPSAKPFTVFASCVNGTVDAVFGSQMLISDADIEAFCSQLENTGWSTDLIRNMLPVCKSRFLVWCHPFYGCSGG